MRQREMLLLFAPQTAVLYGLFTALTSWAALHIVANHAHHPLLIGAAYFVVLLVCGGALLFLPLLTAVRRALSSKLLLVIGVCLLGAADLVRYPVQSHKAHFSTAAPALIEPARQLAHARDPYLVTLDEGAPISPGPGWILLLAPLTLLGGVMLLTPLSIGLCSYLISLRSTAGAGVFVCLVLVQPLMLSSTFIGHDLFAIPIVFAILCLLADRFSERDGTIAILALVAGAFATSRVPMVLLLLILGLGLIRRRRRSGVLFVAISLPLACLFHAVFFLWARHDGVFYQPMHLFHRAGAAGHGMDALGLLGALAVGAWILLRMGDSSRDWILAGGMFLEAAFAPVGVGELLRSHGDLAAWEGANYVSFGASLFLVALALMARDTSPKGRGVPAQT